MDLNTTHMLIDLKTFYTPCQPRTWKETTPGLSTDIVIVYKWLFWTTEKQLISDSKECLWRSNQRFSTPPETHFIYQPCVVWIDKQTRNAQILSPVATNEYLSGSIDDKATSSLCAPSKEITHSSLVVDHSKISVDIGSNWKFSL
jgi:hypothetical protein